MNYFDAVKPTYIENWPDALFSLAPAMTIVRLSQEEAKRLGTNIVEYGEAFIDKTPEYEAIIKTSFAQANELMIKKCKKEDFKNIKPIEIPKLEWQPADITDIRNKIISHLWKYQKGCFIRLGSRSPKDSWSGLSKGFKITQNDDPLQFLLDCSERIYEDLKLALLEKYDPTIVIRQWLDFEPWQEFRCFQKNHRLHAISQYNYLNNDYYDEIIQWHDSIIWAIQNFHHSFVKACHLSDVVFDVIIFREQHGNEIQWEIKLLEINPYFEMTDPCLFAWANEISGFRFRNKDEIITKSFI